MLPLGVRTSSIGSNNALWVIDYTWEAIENSTINAQDTGIGLS